MKKTTIYIKGDIGGRGELRVSAGGGFVLITSWEDVGTAGVSAIMELVTELARVLDVPIEDQTT